MSEIKKEHLKKGQIWVNDLNTKGFKIIDIQESIVTYIFFYGIHVLKEIDKEKDSISRYSSILDWLNATDIKAKLFKGFISEESVSFKQKIR